MASFPKVQLDGPVSRMQDNIAGAFQRATIPLEGMVVLKSVPLSTGSNTVNHTLGRTLQGWFPVRLRASATLYDTQDSNTTPDRTLMLVASAPVTVDLAVF